MSSESSGESTPDRPIFIGKGQPFSGRSIWIDKIERQIQKQKVKIKLSGKRTKS